MHQLAAVVDSSIRCMSASGGRPLKQAHNSRVWVWARYAQSMQVTGRLHIQLDSFCTYWLGAKLSPMAALRFLVVHACRALCWTCCLATAYDCGVVISEPLRVIYENVYLKNGRHAGPGRFPKVQIVP